MIGIRELYGNSALDSFGASLAFQTHVSLPCVVQRFDPYKQVVDVQPLIREKLLNPENVISYEQYPLLVNVPVVYPRAGGFSITFPISAGDECLVVFSDLAIDNWWLNGNVQNPVEQRRHDLSDGIAIFGLKNQTKINGNEIGTKLKISDSDGNSIIIGDGIEFNGSFGSVTINTINNVVTEYPNHKHKVSVAGAEYTTTVPV